MLYFFIKIIFQESWIQHDVKPLSVPERSAVAKPKMSAVVKPKMSAVAKPKRPAVVEPKVEIKDLMSIEPDDLDDFRESKR